MIYNLCDEYFLSKQAATQVRAIVIAYSVALRCRQERNRESSEQSCFSKGKDHPRRRLNKSVSGEPLPHWFRGVWGVHGGSSRFIRVSPSSLARTGSIG